jgi:predicted dehydrogenase
MKINVVVIGSGKMADAYIDVIKDFKNINILGVYSRNKKNLEIFCKKKKVNYFDSYKELYKNKKKIHLLIIAVTATNLLQVINLTKDLNCVRLLEKPLGISLKQAEKIIKITKNKKYFLALNRRMYESTQFAQKKIKKQKIIFVEDHINFDLQKQLGFKKKQYKNFIISHSIHLIDYFNIFAEGKITNIFKNKVLVNNQQLIYCLIEFSSGDVGIYSCKYDSKKKWKVTLFEKNKKIEFQPLETATLESNKNKIKFLPNSVDKHFKPGIYNIILNLNYFFNKKNFKLVSIKEGFEIMKLIHNLHK